MSKKVLKYSPASAIFILYIYILNQACCPNPKLCPQKECIDDGENKKMYFINFEYFLFKVFLVERN